MFDSGFELEARVLGAVIGGGGVAFKDFDLREEDFSYPSFSKIFLILNELYDSQRQFDVFAVDYLLQGDSKAREDLWFAYELGGMFPHLVSGWLGFLYKRSAERLVLQVSMLLQSGESVEEKMQLVKDLQDRVVRSQFVLPDLKFDLQTTLEDILNPKRALKTPFPKLDDLLVGLRGGRLYTFGARPAVGKTLVGMQLAWGMSKIYSVLFASWEMSKEELLKRVFAQELSIRLNDIEQSSLSSVDKQRIQDLIVRADERLLISDDPNMDVDALRRFIINARKIRPVDVVVVDYLQIINIKGRFQDKRVKTDAVTIALKRIAREFDVAVVALAQLNRGAKEDDYPLVSDFKESSQIEQESDVVVLMHRKESEADEVENFNRQSQGLKVVKNLMVLDVAKSRHGATGSFIMSVLGHYSRLGVH